MSDNETKLIVLMPESSRSPYVPDSVVVHADCGHAAYMSPSTVAFVTENEETTFLVVCSDCIPKGLIDDPTVAKGTIPGSRQEMNQAIGVAETDQVIAWGEEKGFQ
jgi:hypothetical protein